MKLLHVDASILGAGSVSRQVSGAIVEALAKANPGLEGTRCDLVSAPLPHLTPASLPGAHPLSSLAPEGDAAAARRPGRSG
jgi:FMN-dependent NADH-azoreductase